MDLNQVIIQHRTICENATAFKLYDALEQSRLLLKGIPIAELLTELETTEETYSNLLSYSMKGINDPQRNMILNSLVVKIVELADKIKEYYLEKNNLTLQHLKHNAFSKLALVQKKFTETLENAQYQNNLADLLQDSKIAVPNAEAIQKHEDFRFDLYEYISLNLWIFKQNKPHLAALKTHPSMIPS